MVKELKDQDITSHITSHLFSFTQQNLLLFHHIPEGTALVPDRQGVFKCATGQKPEAHEMFSKNIHKEN